MEILYEDNHIIIVNKAISEIVQGDRTGDVSLDITLKKYLKEKYNKPGNVFIGVVHRLDRPVSGVVVFAKTSKALSRLNELFRNSQVKKKYLAIVQNMPPSERESLTHYMVRNTRQNKSYCYTYQKPESKKAVLEYALIGKSINHYLLEINLQTGRHHQIRAQLSAIGCPIRGDLKYGFDRSNKYPGICLHAHSVEFVHPVKNEPLNVVAAPPDFEKLWKAFDLP